MRILLWILIFPVGAWALNVQDVPNPRSSNRWTVDQAHVFDPSEIAQMEQILSDLNRDTGAEAALVTLPTIGDRVPKEFTTELFNHWGVGQKQKDNGLLIVLVTDQRRLEMETGYGLEGPLPDITLKRLQADEIVPGLKAGKPGPGFISALQKISDLVRTAPEGKKETFWDEWNNAEKLSSLLTLSFIGAAALMGLFALIAVIRASTRPDPLLKYNSIRKGFGFILFWCVALVLAFVAAIFWGAKPQMLAAGGAGELAMIWIGFLVRGSIANRFRDEIRTCGLCRQRMRRLNPQEEVPHETKNEQIEEKLGSVDYDIWVCPSHHVRKDRYDGKNAGDFLMCLPCRSKTRKMIRDEVITHATSYASGQGIKHYLCMACQKESSERYTIPQISSSSGSSGSSGGSSGGSSFSGGSSGGGGAGSSY